MEANAPVGDGVLVESLLAELVKCWLRILKWAVHFGRGSTEVGLGYEVVEAATGPEAIEKAESLHPNLIMMDLRLPGMNGDEATAHLKKNLSTRNIPVLISTAW